MAWIVAAPDLAYWRLVAPLVISGTGIAMAALSSLMSTVAPQFIGKASGTLSTPRQLGVAFLVRCSRPAGATRPDGLSAAIGACAGLSLVGAVAGLALPRRREDKGAWNEPAPRPVAAPEVAMAAC